MKPRVLVVTFNRLVPADQGNARRIMQMVGLYRARGFEVDLLYHTEEGQDVALSHALRATFGRVMLLPSRAPKRIQHPGHVCRIADWYDPAVGRAARDLHAQRGYRVVHVNYVWYAPLLEQFGDDVVKVLDTHDVFALRSEKYLRAGMTPQWFSTTLEDEDGALELAHAALAIQQEEATEFARRGHRHILYLPYLEPRMRPFSGPDGSRPLTFGYLGSGNDWNILSLNAYLKALKPLGAGLRTPLLVAGGITRHVRETPGVIRLGFVKELHTFYDAIDIALNPMLGGTGLKIKTVEPLGFGKPVLTTPSGAQGLLHLWELPLFDDAAQMAAHVAKELTRPFDSAVAPLVEAAEHTRDALDAEYARQTARFDRWLASRL